MPAITGPGVGYSVQPSTQWRPSAVSGPLWTGHFVRSKLARWLEPDRAVQMTPSRSMSRPREPNPILSRGTSGSSTDGTSYISVTHVSGGLSPTWSRASRPGKRVELIQTALSSVGSPMTP